ncbi:hypothetical protein D3C73_1115340 [compost metagenome]
MQQLIQSRRQQEGEIHIGPVRRCSGGKGGIQGKQMKTAEQHRYRPWLHPRITKQHRYGRENHQHTVLAAHPGAEQQLKSGGKHRPRSGQPRTGSGKQQLHQEIESEHTIVGIVVHIYGNDRRNGDKTVTDYHQRSGQGVHPL